jgi:hypothetical protein
MTTQSDKTARDKLLDDLKTAVDEWYTAEEKRINDEVAFVKSVLRGRTGSERLARANTQEAGILVINDIGTFLSGLS